MNSKKAIESIINLENVWSVTIFVLSLHKKYLECTIIQSAII